MFKSTSFGFRCSSLGKEERTGGDSGTNLEHNRIPRLKKKKSREGSQENIFTSLQSGEDE